MERLTALLKAGVNSILPQTKTNTKLAKPSYSLFSYGSPVACSHKIFQGRSYLGRQKQRNLQLCLPRSNFPLVSPPALGTEGATNSAASPWIHTSSKRGDNWQRGDKRRSQPSCDYAPARLTVQRWKNKKWALSALAITRSIMRLSIFRALYRQRGS